MSETVAIFHYLGRRKIIPYPSDAKEVAKIDEFLSWHHNSLLTSTGLIFFNAWVKPFTNIELPPHGQMVNTKNPKNYMVLDQSLLDLQNLWLKDQKFLVGEKATFADLIAACEIMQIIGMQIYALEGSKYPKVNKWLSDVRSEFNPEFDEAHKKVYRIGEKFGGKPPTIGVLLFKFYNTFRKLLR